MDLSLGFLFIPLIYISAFVPVPYSLDDCSFVVEPKVRQVDSSSSILLSQDCLAIRGFLYFHTNCEIICSSSVKNTVGSLIGIPNGETNLADGKARIERKERHENRADVVQLVCKDGLVYLRTPSYL